MLLVVLTCIVFAFTNVVWRPYIYGIIAYSLALLGFFNGYVTSRYLKFFGATDLWFSVTVSAVVLPMFLFSCLLLEKLFDWVDHIPNRTSNKVMIQHAIIVYIFHASLCYLGALRGYLQNATKPVTPIGKVVRPIPDQPKYKSIYVLAPIFGLV